MIFVTVGTHEQQFDRLLQEIDRLAETGGLPEDVFCQTGYSVYEPKLPSARMLAYEEMQRRIEEASLVIAHGGPGSILPVLARGTPLILVPRRLDFGEHVDDHQVAFCRRLGMERGIPVIEDIGELGTAINAPREAQPQQAGHDAGPRAATAELARLIEALLEPRS